MIIHIQVRLSLYLLLICYSISNNMHHEHRDRETFSHMALHLPYCYCKLIKLWWDCWSICHTLWPLSLFFRMIVVCHIHYNTGEQCCGKSIHADQKINKIPPVIVKSRTSHHRWDGLVKKNSYAFALGSMCYEILKCLFNTTCCITTSSIIVIDGKVDWSLTIPNHWSS